MGKKKYAFIRFFCCLSLLLIISCDSKAPQAKPDNEPRKHFRQTQNSSEGVFLSIFREPHQGAFSILIPKGWNAEGGMISSGVPWNVVDLVENNIRFRVTSPDKKSFFGWYPRFYF